MLNRHTGPGWFPTILPLFILIYIVLHIKYLKHQSVKQKLINTLFIAYSYLIVELTFAPFPYTLEAIEHIRSYHSFRYNLTPLKSLGSQQFSLNILFFVPLGLLLPLVIERLRTYEIVFIGLMVSLGIEITQLLTSITNLNVRSFDIDDLIANTLGTFIGMVLLYCFKALKKLIKKK